MKIDDFPFDEIAEQANSDEELIDLIHDCTNDGWVTNQVLLAYYRLGVIDSNIIRGDDNCRRWLIHGVCHREDGPAIIDGDGTKYYYINDKQLTEEEFNAR